MIQNILKTTIITASLLSLITIPAFAQTAAPTSTTTGRRAGINPATIITNGDTLIADRLTRLADIKTKIDGAKHLTLTDKQKYDASINTAVINLTSLKTKLDADTDAATARADVKSIYTSYRIYAVFMPQTGELAASDRMTEVATQLSTLAAKLQTRIQTAGNPSTLGNLLSDMQAKIADAKTQATNADGVIGSVTPNSYNTDPTGAKSSFVNARANLKTGRIDLQTAWQDAKQIVAALKTMHSATGTVTGTTSATPTH